jgi:uncharacterized protein (TIGR03067 family)
MRCLMFLASAALFAATFGQVAAGSSPDDSDETKIRGTWQLVSSTKKGVETKVEAKGSEPSDDQPLSVTYEEQSWKAKVGPKGAPVEITGTYVLDTKQTPKLLDITVSGVGGSTDVYAVYKFENDQLWIRIRDGNGQRPPDFEISADDCTTLVLRRAAK